MESLEQNTDKLQTLERLDNAGVPVPEWTTERDEISETFGYPALGREEQHTRGQDINLILQWRDAYLTDGNDYFVEYVPTELEYRMHVINGEVVKIHEKRLRSEESNHPFIRNGETGWIFMEPRDTPPDPQLAIDSVGALGLDFGAVDIIKGEDGSPYVLEVNSAPSLDEANLERYGDAFADIVGLNDYPGLQAVSWDDDEHSDEQEGASTDEDEGLGDLFN
jgi:glutathione synthase/RimK-type ligase-like ATP-grasp enzyme